MTDLKLPKTTLFMLMSVDGKISTGFSDQRDFDEDIPGISALAEGVKQYEELETMTDLASFNSGKVMAKVGWNNPKKDIAKIPVDFVLVDNKPHLQDLGIKNLLKRTKRLFIITTNQDHPAFKIDDPNLIVIYQETIEFEQIFAELKQAGMDAITIQSGGTLNARLLRQGLIDRIHIVVLPALIGGAKTPTLVDGEEIVSLEDLPKIKTLKLIENKALNDSFISLKYEVRKG